jgi:hypothetical protein
MEKANDTLKKGFGVDGLRAKSEKNLLPLTSGNKKGWGRLLRRQTGPP